MFGIGGGAETDGSYSSGGGDDGVGDSELASGAAGGGADPSAGSTSTWWEFMFRTALATPSAFMWTVRHAEWRIVTLIVCAVALTSAKLWGFGGGFLLTKYLKAPMEKTGIKFRKIKLSMLRFYFCLKDVELLPQKSETVRGILLSIYPSAHVLTPPSEVGTDEESGGEDFQKAYLIDSASFPGSSVRIESIGIRVSLRLGWFEPVSYLVDRWSGGFFKRSKAKKEDPRSDDKGEDHGEWRFSGGDEETGDAVDKTLRRLQSGDTNDPSSSGGNGGAGKSVDADAEAALPEALRPWYRRLALCGPLPKISVEVRGLHVEIDKAYLAPPPPEGIDVPLPPRPRSPRRADSRALHSSWGQSVRSSLTSISVFSEGGEHIQLPPAALVPIYPEELLGDSDVDDDEESVGELEAMHQLPHFDQETFLKKMDGAGTAAADSLTFFVERWLDYTKRVAERDKAAAAAERWKDYTKRGAEKDKAATAKKRKSAGGGTQDEVGQPADDSDNGDGDASAAGSADSDGADVTDTQGNRSHGWGEKIRKISGDSSGDDARDDDRMNAIFRSVLQTVLSTASLVVYDARFVVTGADGATVKRVRVDCRSPRLASVALARLPREQRAAACISLSRLALKFRGLECDAVVDIENLACVVLNPSQRPKEVFKTFGMGPDTSPLFRRSKATDGEPKVKRGGIPFGFMSDKNDDSGHELIPPHDAALEINGVLPFLIWSINYDHRWERRQLAVSLTLPDRTMSVAPGAVHTFMALMDDFIDPNSPFHEWHNWLSKARRETLRLSDEERQVYRECYLKARGKRNAEGKGKNEKRSNSGDEVDTKQNITEAAEVSNSAQSSKSNSSDQNEAIIVSLEKRMAVEEIMEQRCLAMKDTWRVNLTDKELAEFLRSTESRIRQPDASVKFEESTSPVHAAENNGTPPFRRTYASPLEALVALMREKFDLLAARLSIKLRTGALSVQLINDGSFESRANVDTVLRLQTVEMCVDQRSAIFSPAVLRQSQCGDIESSGHSFSASGTQPEFRQTLNLTFKVQNAIWTPVETESYEGLPSFLDGSLLGLMYELETSSPGPVVDISLRSGISLDQAAFSAIKGKLDDAAVVFNPLPLFSALGVLAAASEIPLRDMDYERQLYLLPPVKNEKANGTLLNGANMSLSFGISNVSLVIPSDITNLHRGCFEVNAFHSSFALDSRNERECMHFAVSSIRTFAARAYGTNDYGGRFLINRLPFKQAFSVSGLEVQYRGQSFQKQKHGSLAGLHSLGKDEACEVGIDLRLTIGQIEGYSSPRINVQLLSSLESLNKAQELLGSEADEEENMQSLIEAQKSEDKYRLRHEALVELWQAADADGSNSLDRDEVEQIILRIFNSSSSSTNMFLGEIPKASRVTDSELQREVRRFLSLADPHHDNDISFQEMDAVLYRKEVGNDRRPAPKSAAEQLIQDIDWKYEFECCYETLCGLLYYDDLREYKNISEVYRITGRTDPIKFRPASLWRKGEGIALFWELYERETGCTKTSLNGQDILIVQQKLVRSTLNYEFAKFCWKSLVGPGLREAAIAGKAGTTRRPRSTDWLLDNDPMATAMTKGVLDHLVKHIQQRTSDKEQELKDEFSTKSDVQYIYSIHIDLKLDALVLGIGNGLVFSRPLIAANAGPLNFEGSALVQPPSQGSIFVSSQRTEPSSKMAQEPSLTGGALGGDRDESEPSLDSNMNKATFQALRLSVHYLNMTHDTDEVSIPPFDIYGSMSYISTKVVSGTDDEQDETTSKTLEIYIPKFINVNISPSLLETITLVKNIAGSVDIEEYDKLFLQRHAENVRDAWRAVGKDTTQELTLNDLRAIFDGHMHSSKASIARALAGDVATIFMKYLDTDGNGTASWDEVERVVMSHTLVFNPVSTRVYNRTGHTMHICSSSQLQGILKLRAALTMADVTASMNHLRDDKCSSIQLYKPVSPDEETVPTDKLVILIPGCKVIDKVPLTSYQSQMFRLRPLKKIHQRRRRGAKKKKQRFGTGFEPYVTVKAESDKIDSITYSIRSSIVVKAQTPIDVRVVCLPSALPFLRKRRKGHKGRKSRDGSADIDLSKKNFALLLQKAVEDAPIIFERQGVSQGSDVPLPISIFLSSAMHVLLCRDLTTGEGDSRLWRTPVLLTKDFLLNSKHISEVVRCHAMSGITVSGNRLNVYRSKKSHRKRNGEATKNRMKTAWDVAVQVHPSFALMNSLPFPIQFQSWQEDPSSGDDEWKEDLMALGTESDAEPASFSEDDEELYDDTESWRRKQSFKKHTDGDKSGNAFYATDGLTAGGTVRLNGIDTSETLFIQISQDCSSLQDDLSKLIWSAPIVIDLKRLRTAGKKSGLLSLPKIRGRLGDSVDVHVDVTVERDGTPYCTLFSPYWITNKTGMKLLYKLTGRENLFDAGVGGIPILASCKVTDSAHVGVAKREIAVMPLEGPKAEVTSVWWDDTTNGKLVIEPLNLKYGGKKRVEWSDDVGLDQAGSFGEVKCRDILFGVGIESLTGVFHRSNLVNISVRYVVKNTLNMPVTIIPVVGLLGDTKNAAHQLREEGPGKKFSSPKHSQPIKLEQSESTIIYQFRDLSKHFNDKDKIRCVLCRIEAVRWNDKAKWHIIPVDSFGTSYYTEYDGIDSRLSGMAKVDIKQQGATTVLTFANPTHPPFLVENRSATHYLQFVQDDPGGIVNEVPPLSFSGYAWCNPLGKKRLRFVSVKEKKSKEHLIEQKYCDTPEVADIESDDDSVGSEVATESEAGQSLAAGTVVGESSGEKLAAGTVVKESSDENATTGWRGSTSSVGFISDSGMPFINRKRLFSRHSRSYDPASVGKQKPLPCPSPAGSNIIGERTSELTVEVHVLSGTRVMSFSDSDFRLKQIEDGLLRSGGDWKNTQFVVTAAGFAAHLTDDFPHEILSIMLRHFSILKPRGSIQASAMLRHFQVDSMFASAKYPVILRPIPMGVDRRKSAREALGLSDSSVIFLGGNKVLEMKDQFWHGHEEQPFPVVEAIITYLPQLHMTWIPQLRAVVCPLKMQIELNFCLRLADLLIDSLPEEKESEISQYTLDTIKRVNKRLQYESGGNLGSNMTYVEDLCIDATWLELDLDIKARDEGDEDGEGDTMLALSSMGRSTKSQLSASLLSWLGNVASAFARVSPKFKFNTLTRKDTYCDAEDLAQEIEQYYVTQCIYQSYKVFFSMHMFGSPAQLIDQYKTGCVSLVTTTRDEIMAGGKDGFGKGGQSFFENVFGGTFSALGKVTGGFADLIDSVATNEYTSKQFKPKSPNEVEAPSNIVEGFTHGTIFLGKAVIHGMVGVVGNPYRGITEGRSASGFAKGVASGVGGLLLAPVVGALGFTAKVTGGTGEMAKISVSVIEARCRPSRVVRWGASIGPIGIPYVKAIGIRIHAIRYQRKYRGLQTRAEDGPEGEEKAYPKDAKEFKQAKAEEEKRRMPPRKVVSVMRAKDRRHHLTAAARPMLLMDDAESSRRRQKVSKYLAVFEETIIMRREDLQLADVISINLWQHKALKAATTKVKPIAQCRLTVGDIYVEMQKYYQEMIQQRETKILQRAKSASNESDQKSEEEGSAPMLDFLGMRRDRASEEVPSGHDGTNNVPQVSLTTPSVQEFAMMKPVPKRSRPKHRNLAEAIQEEMAALKREEEDALRFLEADSSDESSSDSSFENDDRARGSDDESEQAAAMEQLYGHVSLSFFSIAW